MKTQKKAFTLVELMVMVIILMIVWAISFVKYSQYIRDWQDFKRVSDLAQIKIQLDTYKKKHSWILPLVDDADKVAIMNWAFTVANQWDFTSTISWEIWLEKHLLDPELEIPYYYSVSNDKLYYQLATTIMNPESSVALNSSYADLQDPKAYVVGNYIPEWVDIASIEVPGLIYAVSIPWGAGQLDVAVAASKAKVVLNGQTQNLVYDSEWDMQSSWTDYSVVAAESDFVYKKTS